MKKLSRALLLLLTALGVSATLGCTSSKVSVLAKPTTELAAVNEIVLHELQSDLRAWQTELSLTLKEGADEKTNQVSELQ